jgi:hypothetical protein
VCTDSISEAALAKYNQEIGDKDQTQYRVSFTADTLFKDPLNVNPLCNKEDSLVYIQFSCIFTDEELSRKHKDLSIIGCLGLFCVSIFSIAIYYQKR